MPNYLSVRDFFEREYSSSATEILHTHLSDLKTVASELHIDINEAVNSITIPSYPGQENKLTDKEGSRFVTDKSFRGRAAIWVKLKETKGGIQYPFITLKAKGETRTWSGYEPFKEAYDRQKAIAGNADAQQAVKAAQLAKQQAAKQREAERLLKIEADKLAEAQRKAKHPLIKDEYLAAYAAGNVSDGTEPYLVKKSLTQIVQRHPSVRTIYEYYDKAMDEWRPCLGTPPANANKITVVPLARLGSLPAGLQRLSIHGKFQTTAVNDGDYSEAFSLIGPPLVNGNPIDICEGFATTLSTQAATGNSTLFAVSADNVKKLVPIILAAYPDSKVRVISDNDYAKAKKGVGNKGMLIALESLQQYGHKSNFSVFIPRVKDLPRPGTDTNDIHVFHPMGLTELTRQLKSKNQNIKISTFDDKFQLALARFTCLPHTQQIKEHALQPVVLSGLALTPSKYAVDDVISSIIGAARKSGNNINPKMVKAIVFKKLQGVMWGAQQSRAFSYQKRQSPNVIYKQFNSTKITTEIYDYINAIPSGIVIIRAGMGAGKTKELITPLMDQPGRAAYLAHRVSLITGATSALNKRIDENGNAYWLDESISVKHYRNDLTAESAPFIQKLACCINSIVNPIPDAVCQNLDQLFIDEAAQTLNAITIDGAMHAPQLVFNKLLSLMVNTRRVVLCDADANDNLINLCELANRQRQEQQIYVIELKTDCKHMAVQHTNHAAIVTKIKQAGSDNQRLVIATDNCAEAEAMHQMLIEATNGGKGMIITGQNSTDTEQQAFLENLNNYVDHKGRIVEHANHGKPWLAYHGYQWLIYSPAITSGVSIEVPYFEKHFGRFSGISISPSEAIQMLRRDRTAKHFMLGLKVAQNSAETDPNRIINAYYRAESENNRVQYEITDVHTIVKTSDPDFDRMRALTLASMATAKSNFANNILWSMYADGYQVSLSDVSDEEIEQGKSLIESSRELARESLINLVMGVETPSNERLSSLDSKKRVYGLTASEQAEITRHEIELKMQQPVSDEAILLHRAGYLSKLKRAELLFVDDNKLAEYDNHQKASGRAASRLEHASKRAAALKHMFNLMTINPLSGSGETNSEQIKAVFDYFMSDEIRDIHNSILRIGSPVRQHSINTQDPTKWVQGAIERLGFKLERTERRRVNGVPLWHYQLKQAEFNAVKSIMDKRAKAGVFDWDISPVTNLQTGQGIAKKQNAQPCNTLLTPETVMHKKESLIKRMLRGVSDFLNIPDDYMKTQLDRQDLRDLKEGKVTLNEIGHLIRGLWDFDGPLYPKKSL